MKNSGFTYAVAVGLADADSNNPEGVRIRAGYKNPNAANSGQESLSSQMALEHLGREVESCVYMLWEIDVIDSIDLAKSCESKVKIAKPDELDREGHIISAASMVLNTRDMCGNEADAIRSYESDVGVTFSSEEIDQIYRQVNEDWDRCRVEAGVITN